MEPVVVGQFRMEGSCQQFALDRRNDAAIWQARENPCASANGRDDWRTNEYRVNRHSRASRVYYLVNHQISLK